MYGKKNLNIWDFLGILGTICGTLIMYKSIFILVCKNGNGPAYFMDFVVVIVELDKLIHVKYFGPYLANTK